MIQSGSTKDLAGKGRRGKGRCLSAKNRAAFADHVKVGRMNANLISATEIMLLPMQKGGRPRGMFVFSTSRFG